MKRMCFQILSYLEEFNGLILIEESAAGLEGFENRVDGYVWVIACFEGSLSVVVVWRVGNMVQM